MIEKWISYLPPYQRTCKKQPSIQLDNTGVSFLELQKELALEELKLLQEVIARQDKLKTQIKNFALAIFSAVTVAAILKPSTPIDPDYYILTIFLALSAVYLTEVMYGITEIQAEDRVQSVERYLNRLAQGMLSQYDHFDGPRLNDSLAAKGNFMPSKAWWRIFVRSACRGRTVIYYLLILALSLAISFSASRLLVDASTQSI